MSLTEKNPLFWENRIGENKLIPFDKIELKHYKPAFDETIKISREKLNKIINNPEEPTFENTIEEDITEALEDVSNIFFNLLNVTSNNEIQALAQEISPILSAFGNEITMNKVLFARVKKLYDKIDELNLDAEQKRLLETNYKSFVRNGALLNDEDKEKIKAIDIELSKLSLDFMQNVLNATNAYELHITDEKRLAGLPQASKDAAAQLAKASGKSEGWLFNLQIPSILPILDYAKDRELRKEISKAYSSKAYKDKFDNSEIVKKIATLRYKRANILGYKDHAEYVLENRMAEKPKNVTDFINDLKDAAMPFALSELEKLKKFAKDLDKIEELQSYDSSYYSNKLKKEKFDFDDEELKPYFKMENVVAGAFEVAKRLYGLSFTEMKDIPVYHKDVTVYKVTGANSEYIGMLYIDLFPRKSKRGGAWMTTYLTQGKHHGKIRRPHASIVANLTPSTDKTPSLLKLNEVTTIFHEFGHSLHALLSNCESTTLASPNVYWDFVELPSQIMENWVYEKEALDIFAKHYQTDEKIPNELIEKITKVKNFQAGLKTIRQIGLSLLDFAWHNVNPENIKDTGEYEKEALKDVQLYPYDKDKNTSCSFGHVFAGGYSAGYYSYKWAELLEADAFELFKEKGIFNTEVAASFRDNILSKGNSAPPMDLYVKFRGRKPDPKAILRRSGLL